MKRTTAILLRAICAAAVLALPALGLAAPVADTPGMAMLDDAPQWRRQLKLSADQAVLWAEAERATRALLRARRLRRLALQTEVEDALDAQAETQDFAARFAAEEATLREEDGRNRALWDAFAAALDDGQRRIFSAAVRAQVDATELLLEAPAPAKVAAKRHHDRRRP